MTKANAAASDGVSVALSAVVRNSSSSSRSTVLSKQEYESVKQVLQANEDVARHPEVRKQTFRVFRLLQEVSKRFSNRGNSGAIDSASSSSSSSGSSEDPALALVDELLKRHSDVEFDEEKEDESQPAEVDSRAMDDASASKDSSSGLLDDTPPIKQSKDPSGLVAVTAEAPTTEAAKSAEADSEAIEPSTESCLVSSLCAIFGDTAEVEPGTDVPAVPADVVANVTLPAVVNEAPPGLVIRVTDAFFEARNDNEVDQSVVYTADDAFRTLQDPEPGRIEGYDDEEEEVEDDDDELRVRLGRGGPYDNLMRILHDIKRSQGEGKDSPNVSQPTLSRGDAPLRSSEFGMNGSEPARLWLSLDRRVWKVQDTE